MGRHNATEPLPENFSVLMLCDHFSYPNGIRHGVTTYLLETLPVLAATGIRVHVCFLRPCDPLAPSLEASGIETTFLNLSRWDPRALHAVRKVAVTCKASLIHACGMKSSLIARWLASCTGAVPVLHFHDENTLPLPLQLLHQSLAKTVTYGMSVSNRVATLAQHQYSIPEARMEVIGNGINIQPFRVAPPATPGLRQSLSQSLPNARLIGISGRMFAVKGHADMIRMLIPIIREHPETILLCIGDGPERPACEALARALGLSGHVLFLGQRDDVPALLHCLDLLLIPSLSEGLPFSAIEAQAAGCPVVSYDVGDMYKIIGSEVGGLLIPAADSAAFVQAVLRLLGDEELRRRLGKNGSKNAKHFSVNNHVEKLVRFYSLVLTAENQAEPVRQIAEV